MGDHQLVKVGGDRFAILRVHFAGILEHSTGDQVDVLELQRCRGTVTTTCQSSECDQSPVSLLDARGAGHLPENMNNLLEGRYWTRALGQCNSAIAIGWIEIVGVTNHQARPKAWLSC